ncbi:hypothetical protein FRC19_001201 [Serendipita sp. 401]|nr:hypothetical protein FRC19_001201 [Serendipita sp. 401]KAG8836665.1 hypothetical protein FRC18_010930 [Serendipita sp. 400]
MSVIGVALAPTLIDVVLEHFISNGVRKCRQMVEEAKRCLKPDERKLLPLWNMSVDIYPGHRFLSPQYHQREYRCSVM